MKNFKIISLANKNVGDFNLPADFQLLDQDYNQAVFDSILLEQASLRQGTHSTKTKAEVSGTGKKPFAQKKTGNARQGSRRNPHFVGGGVAFGPKPNRNYAKSMNKKVHNLAYAAALSHVLKLNKLTILSDDILVNQQPSANQVVLLLKNLQIINKKILLIINEENLNFLLSARNLVNVIVKPASKVSVRDLINNHFVLIQKSGFEFIINRAKLITKKEV